MLQGYFLNLDSATLATLLTAYTNCLTAIATAGQSYTIGSRTFTRANINEVAQMIKEIKYAQKVASKTAITKTFTDFRK